MVTNQVPNRYSISSFEEVITDLLRFKRPKFEFNVSSLIVTQLSPVGDTESFGFLKQDRTLAFSLTDSIINHARFSQAEVLLLLEQCELVTPTQYLAEGAYWFAPVHIPLPAKPQLY